MESSQKVVLPADRYPATIVSIRVKPSSEVQKDEVLGIYEYRGQVPVKDRNTEKETLIVKNIREEIRSQWAGRISQILVKPQEELTSVNQPLMIVVEPCGHPIQVRGICATCGRDLSIGDYMGNDMTRATINMAHDALGVTVSRDVAERLDKDTTDRLLKERKLILILDLDQTVVHATVDPTVQAWKGDPTNPNYAFLQDVHVFGIPNYQTHYVKLRPGTREFLTEMAKIFEMHIYTMGSRLYANKIAEILDPDNSLFKNRILSRDENLSRSFKSIQRLFPSDQSMVVVLDDRSDVWHWSPNLYKILPFTFFVGTGDIHAPPIDASHPQPGVSQIFDRDPVSGDDDTSTEEQSEEEFALLESAQHHVLEELEKERPLEKLSEIDETLPLTGQDEAPSTEAQAMDFDGKEQENDSNSTDTRSSSPIGSPRRQRCKPVLSESDRELDRVKEVLLDVHKVFYELRNSMEIDNKSDIRRVMSQRKLEVLRGCKIAFSMIFPLNIDPSTQDLWIGAEQFGARCTQDLTDDVTHLITIEQKSEFRSDKVKRARQMPGVFIVKADWLAHSISRWERRAEDAYLLERVNRVVPSIETSVTADPDDDEAILSGRWEHENDIFVKMGHDDIEAMDKEIEDAMADESSDEGEEGSLRSDVDLDAALDAEFDLLDEPSKDTGAVKRTYTDAKFDKDDTSPLSSSPLSPSQTAKKIRLSPKPANVTSSDAK
ncbi:hypothetical protein DFS34DRAFT_513724 [Phlyctochytrium arcticum]|nr:hypothetical protein DFS34DRAFT_513724 [Phlyctochytrium arcticum]